MMNDATPLFSKKIKMRLSEGETLLAIEDLFEYLQQSHPELVNEAVMFKQQFLTIEREKRNGILAFDQYQLALNRINNNILYFIDQLPHLIQNDAPVKPKKNNKGKLLHDIPNRMPLGVATKCTIRIAEDEALLLEGFEKTPNTELEDIPIKEIMEVELIDVSGENKFEIRSLNSAEQTLDPSDYTQWLFFVKPLSDGTHTLFLKVSAIHFINNKERKREIVLEKEVSVATNVEELLTEKAQERKWEDTQIRVSSTEDKPATIGKTADRGFYKIMGLNFSLTVLLLLVGALSLSTVAMTYSFLKWKSSKQPEEKQEIPVQEKKTEPVKKDLNIVPEDTITVEEEPEPVKKQAEVIKEEVIEEDTTLTAEEKRLQYQREIVAKAKKSGYKLIDEISPGDSVSLGNNITIKITTSGFKRGEIDFWISDKYNIKPRHIDGKTYYFEIKSTTKTFDFIVKDTDSGNQIQQPIQGNRNHDWTIKRRVGGFGAD